jgi:transcriptional regulator with XRE-family HTH domain
MDYGTRVRVLRAVHGISQGDLADRTGIVQTYLSHIETGKLMPSIPWDRAIHAALAWTPAADAALEALAEAVGELVSLPEEAAC